MPTGLAPSAPAAAAWADKPSGQRDANRYSRHASSVEKRSWNSKIVRGYDGRGTPRSYETTRMELTGYAPLD